MGSETLLVALVLAAGVLPLVAAVLGARSRRTFIALSILVISLALISTLLARTVFESRTRAPRELEVKDRPIQHATGGYVTSQACHGCHPDQYATWRASYHRTMTQVVSPATVLGTFDVDLEYLGHRFRLERRGDEYWFVDLQPAGNRASPSSPVSHRLTLMTGSHHMQAYWFSPGGDRQLAIVPFVFLIDERRWIPRSAAFLQPPTKKLVVEMGRWSRLCIRCHTTNGRPGMIAAEPGEAQPSGTGSAAFPRPEQFDPRVSEFGIACEACHGPASNHVNENRAPWRRYRFHLGDEVDPTEVQPEHLLAKRSAQVCGQCHGAHEFFNHEDSMQFHRTGYPYRPGEDLDDTRLTFRMSQVPESPRLQEISRNYREWVEGSFWSDGMVRVTGREYNGLIESPCFQRGTESKGMMTCLSCHRMHQAVEDPRPVRAWTDDQLKPGMDGNGACLQCHHQYERTDRLMAHTHHEADSTGSNCYNCHMPYTSYGLLSAIRSHTIDSPTVQASLATGRPNACNQCHMDKTLAWAAEHLNARYAIPRPELNEDERTIAASVLWSLRGDAGQRALMAWSLGWDAARAASGEAWMPLYLAGLLDDPYDAVRLIASRSLRRYAGYEKFQADVMGGERGRSAEVDQALEVWGQRYAPAAVRAPGREAVLMRENGVRVEEIARLSRARDERRMALAE